MSVGDGRGTVYVVATPIGNLDDLSPRAQQVLREVELIACEDTRHTAVLCQRFGIATPRVSLHAHNEAKRGPSSWRARARRLARARLRRRNAARLGSRRAPGARRARRRRGGRAGSRAVGAARRARRERLRDPPFAFAGFLPRKGGERTRALARLAAFPERSCLRVAEPRGGDAGRPRARCSARAAGDRARADQDPRDAHSRPARRGRARRPARRAHDRGRGPGSRGAGRSRGAGDLDAEVRRLLAEGHSPRDAARELAERFGIPAARLTRGCSRRPRPPCPADRRLERLSRDEPNAPRPRRSRGPRARAPSRASSPRSRRRAGSSSSSTPSP